MVSRFRPSAVEVQRVTSAPVPLDVDISRRTRRYLIQMGIRTVCFVLAILVPGVLRWVFLAGAVVLPYVAVLAANAGREPRGKPAGEMGPTPLPAATVQPRITARSRL